MIGLWVVNLLPPGVPQTFTLRTPTGLWAFHQSPRFTADEADIRGGACASTYALEFTLPTDATRSSVKEAAFKEALPICLAASFVTGAAVTIGHPHVGSEIAFVTVGSHFPRERGIPGQVSCVSTMDQFTCFVERFVGQYESLSAAGEKLLLLTTFYIDALSCWSLENLYLSGSTLLQIIAGTEEIPASATSTASAKGTGKPCARSPFFNNLVGAAARVGIAPPSHDVVKIRNSLIHEGTLRSKNFSTLADAAAPIAEALRWVDDYLYAVLKLGAVPRRRHEAQDLGHALNSFSF